MKLNRDNYEEYFILYLDNELGDEDRRRVEAFVQENSDLKAELDTLLQSKLVPDNEISFDNKEMLMVKDSSSVSLNNYESRLIAYIDNELDPQQKNDVEIFIAAHPAVQIELNLLQQTKLQPETIVFPGKKSLYRREKNVRVIPVRWLRLAAAAVLFLGVSTVTVVLINKNSRIKQEEVVKAGPEINPVNKSVEAPLEIAPLSQPDSNTRKTEQKPRNAEYAVKKKVRVPKNETLPFPEKKLEEPVIVKNDMGRKPDNNLTKPDFNPNVKDENDQSIVKTERPDKRLTNPVQKTDVTDVTPDKSDTYNIQNAVSDTKDNPEPEFASRGHKGGVRGFFRKVTRTLEKRTNIKATDDDDRLLIAGLAIKLN